MTNPFFLAKRVYRSGREGARRWWIAQKFAWAETRCLSALKNIHAGERCFIIGNGPSLTSHNLMKLAGEKKFVTNMFPLSPLYEQINVDYYCASDRIHWSVKGGFPRVLREAFRQLPQCNFFFEYEAKSVYAKTRELQNREVSFLQLDDQHPVWQGYFNTDITKPLHWGRTVMIDFCIPLACYLGFHTIYLLGCDYDWRIDAGSNYEKSYFFDITKDERRLHESPAHAHTGTSEHVALTLQAFEVVKQKLEGTPHHIINAGRGGRLDVFPRVDYDSLF